MNPFALSNLLIILTCGPLGYFVYAKNRQRAANRLWFIYTLAILMWGVFGLLIGLDDSPQQALLWWRVGFAVGVIWMPVLFYHFAYVYAPFNEKKLLIAAYVITVIFSASAFSEYFIPRVELVFSSFYWARPGVMFYLMNLYWVLLTIYSHMKLYLVSKKMPHERQNQIKYFIAASGIAYLGGFHDFSVVYGVQIYPWLNFLVILYPIIMTYAIVKHGLFDIFVVIKRIFYSTILIVLIAWSIIGISTFNDMLAQRYAIPLWLAPMSAGVFAVYIGYLFLQAARASDRVKDEFITVAAHKLRTPLTHIRYISEDLLKKKNQTERKALVGQLREANDALIDLVNKLLIVANLEHRAEKYNFYPLDIPAIARTVLDKMQTMISEKKISVTLTIPKHIPLAEGDPDNVSFVVQSIIENAISYTPKKGSITVLIEHDKRTVRFSVTDSGIGIAPEDMHKIFEKFFRARNAFQINTEGTGLAMYMSRMFIKRQGGDMSVVSEGVGKGTTFSFYIPRKV